MSRRLRLTGAMAGVACLVVLLTAGGAVGQESPENASIASLVEDARDQTETAQQVEERTGQPLLQIGSGGIAGVGIGLVIGSLVSFEVWRAKI